MEVLIIRQYASYRVVRTQINWIVYCVQNDQEFWIGAISYYNRRNFKGVRVAVTELPPAEPLEERIFEISEVAVKWIIDLSEKALESATSSATLMLRN